MDPGNVDQNANHGIIRRSLSRLAFLITGTTLILGLLFLGPRGDYTVSVLNLLLTFLFGVLGSMAARRPPQPGQAQGMTRNAYIINFVMFAILGGVGGYFIHSVVLGAVRVPASELVVENADGFSPTAPATVVFKGRTPDKQNLGIKLAVVDNLGTGDCSTSPRATLYPFQGGAQLEPVEVDSLATDVDEASETRIKVNGPADNLKIKVSLNTRPGCILHLDVKEAVFYD